MITTDRIGNAAGKVWEHLRAKNGTGCTVSELKRTKGLTGDEVLAGIGWLAREGKLSVENEGRKTIVRLVADEMTFTC